MKKCIAEYIAGVGKPYQGVGGGIAGENIWLIKCALKKHAASHRANECLCIYSIYDQEQRDDECKSVLK